MTTRGALLWLWTLALGAAAAVEPYSPAACAFVEESLIDAGEAVGVLLFSDDPAKSVQCVRVEATAGGMPALSFEAHARDARASRVDVFALGEGEPLLLLSFNADEAHDWRSRTIPTFAPAIVVRLTSPFSTLPTELLGWSVQVEAFWEPVLEAPPARCEDGPLSITSWLELQQACETTAFVIPAAIDRLTSLRTLELGNGDPSRPVPSELTKLTSLTSLGLHGFNLGEVDGLMQLGGLVSLGLDDNRLTNLPENIGRLTALTSLSVGNNRLASLPASLGGLSSLRVLGAEANALRDIPRSIGKLSSLKTLRLSDNLLEVLPEEFGDLSSLADTDLSQNRLRALPDSIGKLSQLLSIQVRGHNLTALPPSFANLTQLVNFGVRADEIPVLPVGFSNITRLFRMIVEPDVVSLSPQIGNWTQMVELFARNGRLRTLPDEFGALSNLRHVWLQRNEIETLPDSFGQLANLERLFLDGNRLERLPETVGGLKELNLLRLEDNRLTRLPDSVELLSKLQELSLARNKLGSLPEGLGSLAALTRLSVQDNRLGELPASLAQIQALNALALHNNDFVCDMRLESWFAPLAANPNLLIENVDDAKCSDVNEYSGNPIHRLQFDANEPTTFPTDVALSARTNSTLTLSWTYSPSSTDGAPLEPSGQVDCAELEKPRLDPVSEPALAYFVEIVELGPVSGPGGRPGQGPARPALVRRVCTSETFATVTGLSPNTNYGLTVRAANLRWDIAVYLSEEEPGSVSFGLSRRLSVSFQLDYHLRSSSGPRTPLVTLSTSEASPGSAPEDVVVQEGSVGERELGLMWSSPKIPNGRIDRYEVWVARDGVHVAANTARVEQASLSGLQPGTEYEVSVRAWTASGPGPFSDVLLARTLDECPAGTQRFEGPMRCEPCLPDTYRSTEQPVCLRCPKAFPRTMAPGATSEGSCVAQAGFVTVNPGTLREGERVALSCESEQLAGKVDCPLDGLTVSTFAIKAGFWRISNVTLDIRSCPVESFCQGSQADTASRALQATANQSVGWGSSGDSLCAPYHRGILCADCVSGFAIGKDGCEPCTADRKDRDFALLVTWCVLGVLAAFVPAAWLVALTFHKRSSRSGRASRAEGTRKRWRDRAARRVCLLRPSAAVVAALAVKLRILLGFYQVFFQFARTLDLMQGSQGGVQVVIDLDVSSVVRAFEVGCAMRFGFYTALLAYTLFPLAIVASMAIVVFGVTRQCASSRLPRVVAAGTWATLQLCFLVYPGVSSAIFRTFHFDEMPLFEGDTEPYVAFREDYTVDFASPESAAWRVYAACMIAVYPVGVVVLFALCVRAHGAWVRAGEPLPDSVYGQAMSAVSFLAAPYKFAPFECYELLRKLVLTSLFMLLHQASRPGSIAYFQAMNIVFLVLLALLRPYKSRADHLFAQVSLALLTLLGCVASWREMIDEVTPKAASTLTSAIAAAEALCFVMVAVGSVHRSRRLGDPASERQRADSPRKEEEIPGALAERGEDAATSPVGRRHYTDPAGDLSGSGLAGATSFAAVRSSLPPMTRVVRDNNASKGDAASFSLTIE